MGATVLSLLDVSGSPDAVSELTSAASVCALGSGWSWGGLLSADVFGVDVPSARFG